MRRAPYSLRDKLFLITGAASGLGRALSVEACRAGARAALLDRDGAGLDQVCARIGETGGSACGYLCDLTDPPEILRTVERIRNELGPVDLLVNCAAAEVHGLVEEVPLADFKRCHDLNFYGPLVLIQAVIPMMKRSGGGQIVNISTSMGRRSFPGKVAYCATKFALNALTEGLRLELKPFQINVMMVSPGPMNTNWVKNTVRHGRLEEIRGDRLVRRQDPTRTARRILRGLERRSRTVIQWTPSELLVRIHALFPRLADFALSRLVPVPGPKPEDRVAPLPKTAAGGRR